MQSQVAGINSKCRLCLQKRKLCKSHIFPEFFYKPMYDEKGRFLMIPADASKRVLFKQQGVYELLLCEDCEEHTSRLEAYARRVFFEKMEYIDEEGTGLIRVVNLDYAKFKLFQLSLLWRAGVSRDSFFSAVRLGPHEDRIRRMILESRPGKPYEYGCAIFGLALREGQALDIMLAPDRGHIDSNYCYRFILGSCIWAYVVSNHSVRFEGKSHFLQENGSLLLQTVDAKSVPFIRKAVDQVLRRGKISGV